MAEHKINRKRELTVRDLVSNDILPAVIESGNTRYKIQTPEQYFYVMRLLKGESFTINGLYWTPKSKITYSMLMGKDLFFLRRRITNIKNMMHIFLKRNEPRRNTQTLLSIGAGRGGDILRWRHYKKIVLVEPNSNHIKELRHRLKSFPEIDYLIIQAKGQDAEDIIAEMKKFMGNPDVIEFMLSLTFFDFSNRHELRALGLLMRNAKYVIILTPDGKKMMNLICSRYNFKDMKLSLVGGTVRVRNRDLVIEEYKITPEEPHLDLVCQDSTLNEKVSLVNAKIQIHIPNSIVDDQEEYLVPTQNLERLSGGRIIYEPDIMGQELLTTDDVKYLGTMVGMVIKTRK